MSIQLTFHFLDHKGQNESNSLPENTAKFVDFVIKTHSAFIIYTFSALSSKISYKFQSNTALQLENI